MCRLVFRGWGKKDENKPTFLSFHDSIAVPMLTRGIKSFCFLTFLINQAPLEVKDESGIYLHLSFNLYLVACFKMVLPGNMCILIKMPITFVPSALSDKTSCPHILSSLCIWLVIYMYQTPTHWKAPGVWSLTSDWNKANSPHTSGPALPSQCLLHHLNGHSQGKSAKTWRPKLPLEIDSPLFCKLNLWTLRGKCILRNLSIPLLLHFFLRTLLSPHPHTHAHTQM